jgi:protein-disulfide isomerase
VVQKKRNAASSDPKTKWFYIAFGIVGLAAVATLGYSSWSGRSGGAATAPVQLTGVENARTLMEMAQPERKGDPDAPVQMHTFIDFQCPGCRSFALQIEPQIEARYVADGRVQIVYYDFPLPGHRHAFVAARAARCAADQGEFWAYHDVLLAEQGGWSAEANPQSRFFDFAENLGLDRDEFAGCLRSDRHAELVSANVMLGQQLGVSGTPSVFLNSRAVRDPFDYQRISALIEEELAAGS